MGQYCFLIILTSVFLFNCSRNESSKFSDSYYKGKQIYIDFCTSCHNIDPFKAGALAPEVAGTNLEIIRSMVMTGKLPEGIKPKWPDRYMAPLPHLEDKIPDLHEYLKTFK